MTIEGPLVRNFGRVTVNLARVRGADKERLQRVLKWALRDEIKGEEV
jgi:hypothetical protein